MADFPHLNLIQVLEKKTFKPGTVRKTKSAQTRYNLEHRQEHFNALSGALNNIRQGWQENIQAREDAGLPPLGVDGKAFPVYLKIDLDAKDIESLTSFGINVISEEEGGFILGANVDDFKKFEERLDQFLNESNKKFKDSAASILEIVTDPIERLRKILSPDLFSKWHTIRHLPEITVYVAISAYLRTPDYPIKDEDETNDEYERKLNRWKQRSETWQRTKDDLARDREAAFENVVTPYNAEFLGSYIEFDDGFGCKLRISGQGFVDMCLNCPYIFSVEEHDELGGFRGTSELEQLLEVEVLAPNADKPKICVIDSGIQEGHRLLSPAIDNAMSVSYVPNDTDTFDKVSGGGHGTRVAGAILYPVGLAGIASPYQLPFWIQNARILNQDNKLSSLINEVDAMNDIVNRYSPTRLFNLSASRERPQSYTHMPLWAAAIDCFINVGFQSTLTKVQFKEPFAELYKAKNLYTDNEEFPEFTLIIGFANQMYQIFLPFSDDLDAIHDPKKDLTVSIFPLFFADKLQKSDEYYINKIYMGSDKPVSEDHKIVLSFEELRSKK